MSRSLAQKYLVDSLIHVDLLRICETVEAKDSQCDREDDAEERSDLVGLYCVNVELTCAYRLPW